MMNDKIHNYILENKDSILRDYFDILRFPSISDTQECYALLSFIKELYERNFFKSELYQDYLLSYYNKGGTKSIGLFAHADVVPADDKWTVTQPFEPRIVHGQLFARGALDDKSAVILSLYALKAIRDLKIPFNSSVVCFTGANEESSMSDIKSYIKSHTPPDFSLVLDAGFPLYYGDKGLLWVLLTFDDTVLDDLIDIKGGESYNIILGEAEATVKYSPILYEELSRNKRIKAWRTDNLIKIYARGISSHGALPQGSVNAGGIILDALFKAKSFSQRDKERLSLAYELLNTYDGEILGINSSDEIYGNTTATNGVLKMENGKLMLSLDIRYGKAFTSHSLISHLTSLLDSKSISLEIVKQSAPHYTDLNNSYIKACLRAYREHTGDTVSEPRINAGVTYSCLLPASAEIGTTTKYFNANLPIGHGGAHQPNEHISVEGFMDALEIVIKMLIECDRTE